LERNIHENEIRSVDYNSRPRFLARDLRLPSASNMLGF
jgi:hypothetical protein